MNEKMIILMGVSGCGKSAVGQALSKRMEIPFLEGDEFHPPENVAKMSSGIPLEDDDRIGWMSAIRDAMTRQSGSAIVSCSALKRKHRSFLSNSTKPVLFVHLHGDRSLLEKRIKARVDHFFDPKLLSSQLACLEKPCPDEGVLVVDVDLSVENIAATIHAHLETFAKN